MSDPDGKLRQAVASFRAGDMGVAERACGEVLQLSPGHPGALHLLGLIYTALRRLAEAVGALGAAARRLPDDPAVHVDLGVALSYQGRHAEATVPFRRAIALDPGNPGMHLNLGNALAEQGRMDEAQACYRKMLDLDPGLAVAHFSIGKLYERHGRLAHAEAAYQAALGASPDHAGALHNLGAVYQRQGRTDSAISCYRKVLALDPDHVQALNNLGNVLSARGQPQEAARLYQKALASHPAHPLAYVNLANLRGDQCQYADARLLYEKAASLDPGDHSIFVNLGTVLSAEQSWDAATAQFERALELRPSNPDALYNLGLVRLFQHRFEQAWAGYEQRLRCERVRKTLRKGAETLDRYERLARWRGPGETGVREVAIWSEQGIGDQLLYSTLIPELIAAAAPFVYEVESRLLGAYQRAFPGSRFMALSKSPVEALQAADRVLLAGSLPALFRKSRADFARQPARLLAALPERVAHYRERLEAEGPGLKVALSWRSKNVARMARLKSTALMELAPLLKLPGARFVDVQYGDTRVERRWAEAATGSRITHFDEVDYYNDLEELLAILEACDLVVTTSNATAHFAGVLGKRTWLLYPADRAPFHYWAHGGARRSLWYPAVEIVTAPDLDDWTALIKRATAKLAREIHPERLPASPARK